MKDSIRIPGTPVKVKSLSARHEGVEGTVDKDYGNTVQVKVYKEYESHKHAYKSRLGHFNLLPGQSHKDYRDGKFIMVRPDALREIPPKKES